MTCCLREKDLEVELPQLSLTSAEVEHVRSCERLIRNCVRSWRIVTVTTRA
jgi:hypothetical protein